MHVYGEVKDSSGNAIPNAKVEVNSSTQMFGGIEHRSDIYAITDQQGAYSIDTVKFDPVNGSFVVTPQSNSKFLTKSILDTITSVKTNFDILLVGVNDSTGVFVTGSDITPPTFTPMQNIVVDATAANGATVKYQMPEVKDENGISYGPICEPKSGSFFPIGSKTVTLSLIQISEPTRRRGRG